MGRLRRQDGTEPAACGQRGCFLDFCSSSSRINVSALIHSPHKMERDSEQTGICAHVQLQGQSKYCACPFCNILYMSIRIYTYVYILYLLYTYERGYKDTDMVALPSHRTTNVSTGQVWTCFLSHASSTCGTHPVILVVDVFFLLFN